MPPKRATSPASTDPDPVLNLLANLQKSVDLININLKSDKFNSVSAKVDSHEEQLSDMRETVNSLEQRGRMNSVRISGLQIDKQAAGCPIKTCNEVYLKVLRPIFEEAVRNGDILSLSEVLQCVEYGHLLPSGKGSDIPNIIIRLTSRLYKQCIFRHKRKVMSSSQPLQNVFLYEDLTYENRKRLMETKANPATLRAWTVNGRLRYVLKDSPNTVRTWSLKNNPLLS